MIIFMMCEDNLKKILRHPLVGIGTDGSALAPYGPLKGGKPHPRNYGTFPRVLGKYIRKEKVVSMSEMLKKMTSIPARKFHFLKRGIIEKGYFADIVVFDEDHIADRATWTKPCQYPKGIHHVIVNGKIVIEGDSHTGAMAGMILKKSLTKMT